MLYIVQQLAISLKASPKDVIDSLRITEIDLEIFRGCDQFLNQESWGIDSIRALLDWKLLSTAVTNHVSPNNDGRLQKHFARYF